MPIHADNRDDAKITAAIDGLANYVGAIGSHQGRDCLMTPVGDSGPLAEALVRAVRDPELRARLAEEGRETAGRFTWAAAAERHEEFYERVAGGVRGA